MQGDFPESPLYFIPRTTRRQAVRQALRTVRDRIQRQPRLSVSSDEVQPLFTVNNNQEDDEDQDFAVRF